jgi:hypothetical protein
LRRDPCHFLRTSLFDFPLRLPLGPLPSTKLKVAKSRC